MSVRFITIDLGFRQYSGVELSVMQTERIDLVDHRNSRLVGSDADLPGFGPIFTFVIFALIAQDVTLWPGAYPRLTVCNLECVNLRNIERLVASACPLSAAFITINPAMRSAIEYSSYRHEEFKVI